MLKTPPAVCSTTHAWGSPLRSITYKLKNLK